MAYNLIQRCQSLCPSSNIAMPISSFHFDSNDVLLLPAIFPSVTMTVLLAKVSYVDKNIVLDEFTSIMYSPNLFLSVHAKWT